MKNSENLLHPLDNRKNVSLNKKIQFPYSAFGLVKAKFGKKDSPIEKISTGTLIGPDIVLTSASNIISYNKKLGEAYEIDFWGAFDGYEGVKCTVKEWKIPYEF